MVEVQPTEKQKRILEVLADECQRNPKTSLTGIDMRLLGYKVGAYLGIGVMYDVAKLKALGFVSRYGRNVIITQKGLSYIKSRKGWAIIPSQETGHKLMWGILIPVIIAIFAGVVVALITGWHPW